MSRRIAELLDSQPGGARGAAREARPRHLGRDRRGELPATRSSSSPVPPQAIDRAGARPLRAWRAARSRSSGRSDADALLVAALPALRGALARRRGRRRPRGRPEPGGGRVRLVGARAGGEPGRRAVPGPPDQHQAQAARRSTSTPRRTTRDELAEAFRAGVAEYGRWYRDYYERNLDDETRPFPIDPAGPRVVLVPGVGIVTSGARRRPRRGSRATSTTVRSPSRTPRTRSAASGR